MMTTQRIAAGGAVALAIAAAPAGATELRFANWLPAQHVLNTTVFPAWIDSLVEASGGEIEVAVFPARQLGAAGDHYDLAANGIADIAFINTGYQPGRFPMVGVAELPFLIDDPVTAETEAFDGWYREYAEEEMAEVKFCLTFNGGLYALHSVEPVVSIEDIDGMRIRLPNRTLANYFGAMGATNIQISAPESREALERGVADAILFPWASLFPFGINDVVQNHLDIDMAFNNFAFVMNQATYDGLSDRAKAAVDSHCTSEWAARISSGWLAVEADGRQRLIDDGHTINVPSAEQLQAFQDAVEPVRNEWLAAADDAGYDGQAAYDALIEAFAQTPADGN
ncbi:MULTISPECIES: TRAP transporter substrate-binding protein [Paracoccaceae]|jgi:TRAP-type C4-dicarboxylate transport system substrate-binding protein|uniref:TRAP transporter substrate-binding protein n=1 Tax=Rhodobacterales TaxID=204455 RepID=UPI001D09D87B|nr:TRAP transporter substrate-binding protein [Boseongicola sp. H5]